jgi:uncharacterized membrane protein
MSALSRPRRLAALLLHGVDFVASSIGRAGLGAFAWPVAIAVGLGTGIFGLRRPEFVASVTGRRATMDFMFPALFAVAVSLLAVIVVALIIAWLRKRRTSAPMLATYTRVVQGAAVLTALPFVVALRLPLTPQREWLALVFIVATAALATYSVYKSLPERTERAPAGAVARIITLVVLGCTAMAFVLRVSSAGIANHLSFSTGRVDLGFYVSRFREASQGHLFGCSLCSSGTRHSYEHLEPIVAFFAPVYALHPFAETLIVLQAVVVASGAVAVFFLARALLGNLSALVLAVAYLTYPPLLEIALFDFHAVTFAIPLCLFLLLALHAGRTRTYLALAIALLLVREDMGFVLLAIGLYAIATDRPKLGWGTIALAVIGLVVMHFASPAGVLEPLRDVFGELTVRRRKGPQPAVGGEFWLALVQRMFHESKALYTVALLSPLLGLSLLARGRVLLLYGALLALAAPVSLAQSPSAHETSLLVPFLFALAVWALKDMVTGRVTYGTASGPKLGRALSLGILVCSLLQCYELGPLLRDVPFRAGPHLLGRYPDKQQIALDRDLHKLSVSWPKGVKVAASSNLLPHLGGASHLYALDDRAGTDYVVASMNHRLVARHMETEEKEHQLERVATFGDVRVYRAQYRTPLPYHARHLDDE